MSDASEIAGESRLGAAAPHKQSPKKILIVRLGAMGDIVHALPAVVALKSAFPNAQIGWVVERRWSDLLAHGALVDRLHEVDTRRWRRNLWGTRHETRAAIRELRKERYDFAVDFQGAMKSAVLALLSGAPTRFGFAHPWEKAASLFYTHTIETKSRHVVEQDLELAEAVIQRKGRNSDDDLLVTVFHGDSELQRWLDRKILELRLHNRFAILNPGAGWGAKQWPIDRFAEVARVLGAEGIRSLVNFGPGEEELARYVEQNSGGHAVAASFSISQLMAITQRAALFIGGDTGPLHLAAFLNVPVVAIFGPTDPARTGPYGTRSIVFRDPASVTSHKRRKEAEAGLLNITAAEVIAAARELLQINSSGVRA
ncbi:MAG TPA: lipopolysaccharide heptosyltransferase I [Terriglobales bacterium]|nr:lipopolysaccharide heptosyltransferase I [Terriglobales bacterium]